MNFLRELKFKGEKKEIDEKYFSEEKLLGRKLYEYSSNNNYFIRPLNKNNLDWPFPDKFYNSIGYTIHVCSFTFKNAANNLSTILNPSNDLINVESGLEEVENTLIDELFYTVKSIKEKIEEYNAIPIKYFINESYFLYNKSNLIKNTFITTINKQLSLYGSFSYFSGKTSILNLKLLSFDNFLKFLIEKNSLKSNLKLQLAHVNGSEVSTSDKKIHNFSITKLGKRKKKMQEPNDSILIRAQ